MHHPHPAALERNLVRVLPSARLAVQCLAEAPDLRLLLLAPDYPRGALDADSARRVMDTPLYWVFCWASGQVLARLLLEHPQWVRDRRVLDFGCGSGVVAIAAALAGAREVIACDVDPLALQATAFNARLNGVSLSLCEDFHAVAGHLDLITVADVLYDRENLPWLERFARRAPAVLVADSRIRDFAVAPYRALGRWDSCTLPDLDESAEFRRVTVYASGG